MPCGPPEEVESGALSRRRGRRGSGLLIVVLHQMTMWRTVEHHQGTPQPPRRRAQSPPTWRVVRRVVQGAAPVVRSCLPLRQPSRGAEQSRAPDTPAISSSTRRPLSAGGDRGAVPQVPARSSVAAMATDKGAGKEPCFSVVAQASRRPFVPFSPWR
jgi:hypothetical protein